MFKKFKVYLSSLSPSSLFYHSYKYGTNVCLYCSVYCKQKQQTKL